MKIAIINILCLIIVFGLSAQEHNSDAIINENISAYVNAVNEHLIIFSGREEKLYSRNILNHPFLDTNEFRKGMISFDGRIYPNLMLRLNLDRNELIVMTPDKNFSIIIPEDKLDYAMIDSLYILYNNAEFAKENSIREGYYIRIYNGEHQVWKYESFTLNSKANVSTGMMDNIFEKKIWLYIYKDGIYHPVKSKSSVLKFFASKKKELKKHIKELDLSFYRNPENAIVSVAEYYEKLNNTD